MLEGGWEIKRRGWGDKKERLGRYKGSKGYTRLGIEVKMHGVEINGGQKM